MDRQEHARTFLTNQLDFLTIVALDQADWDELYVGVAGWGIPYQAGYDADDANPEYIMPVCWDELAKYPADDEDFKSWLYWIALMATAYAKTKGGEGARLAACAHEMESNETMKGVVEDG